MDPVGKNTKGTEMKGCYWIAYVLFSAGLASILYEWVLPFLNKRLKREHNWIDVVICVFLPTMTVLSPLFAEYGFSINPGESYQAVAFDNEGNVEDSSSNFVWCVTNNCATVPWKLKVAFDESAIKDGKIVRFVIDGEAEVTDYSRFFTIPGVIKPTGWWNTPSGDENVGVLSKVVTEQLCQLVTRHTAELANVGFPLPRSILDTSVDDLVDKYAQPNLSQYGIKYNITKFLLKDPCNCAPSRNKFDPSAY